MMSRRTKSSSLMTCTCACALLALLLHGTAVGGENKQPPAPSLVVEVGPAQSYPAVDTHFTGSRISADGRSAARMERRARSAIFPDPGKPLAFEVSATAHGGDRTVRVTGIVRDFSGKQLAEADCELKVKDGQTAVSKVEFTPTENDRGPFFFVGEWTEVGGEARGAIPAGDPERVLPVVVAMPNARFVIEDFECVRHAEPGAVVENSSAAKRGGRMGLALRPKVPATGPGSRPKEGEKPVARHSLPLGRNLPGRPVRIGLWVNTSAPARLTLRLRDPGIDVQQSLRYDRWVVGPIAVAPGGWRYVAFPAPGYGLPEWQRTSKSRLGSGLVDYPLTAEALDVECDPGTTVMIDEVDVFTQMSRDEVIRMRAILDKPNGLLYRNDTIRVALANGWLWGPSQPLDYIASLFDIAGREWPLAKGTIDLPPGGEQVLEAKMTNLPLGSYRLKAAIKSNGKVVANIDQQRGLLVYEPAGKPAPHAKLLEFLKDRHALVADLGLRSDILLAPWHSTDGTVSVEAVHGYFHFDWLEPEYEQRRLAGFDVVGRLGLTPVWADAGWTYLSISNSWAGNTTVMPSRDIYWEEYAHRTMYHFAGRIRDWIVWERPDAPSFASGPEEYTDRMLATTYRAAQEADPNIRLISGGVSRHRIEEFLNGLIESGAGRYLHAVGLLPTTTPMSPEDGYMDVILSRAHRLRVQEHFRPELWVLNLGWPTGADESSITEDDQARYVARAYAICRANGVAKVILPPHRTVPSRASIQVQATRDSADLVFIDSGLLGVKPAALAARTARNMLADSTFAREVFLVDRWDGLARAYLFRRKDGRMVLAAWRRHGTSRLRLPKTVETVLDTFGNEISPAADLTLHGAPHYLIFPPGDPEAIARELERSPLDFDDAPESAWKRSWTFFLDLGDPADEKAAQYAVTDARLEQGVDSHYHNDYGRRVIDDGRPYRGEERFVVDVSDYGTAAMILRKRIDYSMPNQRVKVYCNGEEAGQWFTFKRDRRFRWRNTEFIIPNNMFAGKKTAELRIQAQDCEATAYAYWAAPLRYKKIYLSDMSLLVNNSGYGAGVNLDANILGGPIRFHKGAGKSYDKGLGTNAASTFEGSLIVVPLNKQFKRFRATVGIDAATGGRGTVRFRVGDGTRQLYDSKDMTYYSEPGEIDVDVSESIILMLSTNDSGDGNKNDIANWADAQLELK